MILTIKEVDWILTQLDDNQLTEWEEGFVRSVRALRAIGSGLTTKQIETLSRIWDKQGG